MFVWRTTDNLPDARVCVSILCHDQCVASTLYVCIWLNLSKWATTGGTFKKKKTDVGLLNIYVSSDFEEPTAKRVLALERYVYTPSSPSLPSMGPCLWNYMHWFTGYRR